MAGFDSRQFPGGTWDAAREALARYWDGKVSTDYGKLLDDYVGPEMWSPYQLAGGSEYENLLMETGGRGAAVRTGDHPRQHFPTLTRDIEAVTLAGFYRVGVAAEWYNDYKQRLGVPGLLTDFSDAGGLVADLPRVLRDAEELDYLEPYNLGRFSTKTSREYSSLLFVDGSMGHEMRYVGGKVIPGASNIFVGAPSYDMIFRINQYAEYFPTEEGGIASLNIDRIICPKHLVPLWEALFNSASNVNSANPGVASPIAGAGVKAPKIIGTHNLWEMNDSIVLLDGWQDDFKVVTAHANKFQRGVRNTDQPEEFHVFWARTETRRGFHIINNRRVLLIQSAAPLRTS